MSRHKSGVRRPLPEIGLFMECDDEELSPAQNNFYGKIKKEHTAFKKKLDDYVSKLNGNVIVEEGNCFLFDIQLK